MVRVFVRDSGSTDNLVQMLHDQFDADAVSFDEDQGQVSIASRGNTDRELVRALDVLFEWVASDEAGPTKVDVEGRVYELRPPARRST